MRERGQRPGEGWDADWSGHRRAQHVYALEATPAQRLAWLEQAIELAHRVGALPRRRPADDEPA